MDAKMLTSRQYTRQLSVIKWALIGGQLLFLTVVCLFIERTKHNTSPVFFKIAVPTAVILAFIGGKFLKEKALTKARQKTFLREKLSGFQAAFIARLALLEGSCLFCIVAYLLTTEVGFLLYFAAGIIVQASEVPSREKIEEQLSLNENQKALLANPEAVVAEVLPYRH